MGPEHHPFAQLGLLGLSADDIKLIVYTHLHCDHCPVRQVEVRHLH